MRRALTSLLVVLSASLSYAQQQSLSCPLQIEYGNKNQIDPKRLSIRGVVGSVIAEVGRPAKEIGPIPACLGLFTEMDYRLVASAVADQSGRFNFGSVPTGRYRLVVRDPQNAFCVANIMLRVVRWPRSKTKPLVIHLRPAGIDDCSYAGFK
jgi:hypothetical protein